MTNMHASTDPPRLYWTLRRRCAELGIASVPELAGQIGAARQSLYGHWEQRTKNIKVEMLERFGLHLGRDRKKANMGDWFAWDGDTLRWNIRQVAESRLGITKFPDFYWAVQLYPQQADLYWSNKAEFVAPKTLAALARPFLAAEVPFDTGDFFSWTAPAAFGQTVADRSPPAARTADRLAVLA